MDFNIEVRKKQLDSLGQLISSSKERLSSVLTFLGWGADKLKKEEDCLTKCPLNSSHKMPLKSVEKHLEKCMVKIEGYDLNEKFLSEPPIDSKHTTYLDNTKKIEILSRAYTERPNFRQAWNGRDPDPKTSDRLISTFSPNERLAIYDYCIQNTVGPPTPSEFTTFHKCDEDKPLSYEELLAQERDAKRRRAKYRSVHVNRKNHTEVIREVINNQMDDYKDWILLLTNSNKKNEDCNDRINGKEEHSYSSSNSERRKRQDSSRSMERRERSRDRNRKSNDRNRRSWDINFRSRDRSSRRRDLSRDRRRRSLERNSQSHRRSEDRKYRNDSRQRARSPYKTSKDRNGRSIDQRHKDVSSNQRDKEKSSTQKDKSSKQKEDIKSCSENNSSSQREERLYNQKKETSSSYREVRSLKEKARSSRRERENSFSQRDRKEDKA